MSADAIPNFSSPRTAFWNPFENTITLNTVFFSIPRFKIIGFFVIWRVYNLYLTTFLNDTIRKLQRKCFETLGLRLYIPTKNKENFTFFPLFSFYVAEDIEPKK